MTLLGAFDDLFALQIFLATMVSSVAVLVLGRRDTQPQSAETRIWSSSTHHGPSAARHGPVPHHRPAAGVEPAEQQAVGAERHQLVAEAKQHRPRRVRATATAGAQPAQDRHRLRDQHPRGRRTGRRRGRIVWKSLPPTGTRPGAHASHHASGRAPGAAGRPRECHTSASGRGRSSASARRSRRPAGGSPTAARHAASTSTATARRGGGSRPSRCRRTRWRARGRWSPPARASAGCRAPHRPAGRCAWWLTVLWSVTARKSRPAPAASAASSVDRQAPSEWTRVRVEVAGEPGAARRRRELAARPRRHGGASGASGSVAHLSGGGRRTVDAASRRPRPAGPGAGRAAPATSPAVPAAGQVAGRRDRLPLITNCVARAAGPAAEAVRRRRSRGRAAPADRS